MTTDYSLLVPSENRGKPKFMAMVSGVSGTWSDLSALLATIPSKFDMDTAMGTQLDTVGAWVGQSRAIPNSLLLQFFGFADSVTALNMGEETHPETGGRFCGEGESLTATTVLSDPEFRILIKGKILRNITKGSTADIIAALQYMFGASSVVDDPGTMAIGLAIGRPLTYVERAILTQLDILPRPSGVHIAWKGYYTAGSYLGFFEQVGAVPFAEEGYVGNIGSLMEEF